MPMVKTGGGSIAVQIISANEEYTLELRKLWMNFSKEIELTQWH